MRASGLRSYALVGAVLLAVSSNLAAAGVGEGTEKVAVLVELLESSTLEVYMQRQEAAGAVAGSREAATAKAEAAALARAQLLAVQRSQDAFMAALEGPAPGTEQLYRIGTVLNGVALRVPVGFIDTIKALPGVKAVYPIAPKHLTEVSSSILGGKLIGAPEAWDPAGLNLRGDGIRVAVIDGGVDYIHKDLGGSGSYSGQSYADSSVPWTAKVVGGWDFVGDDYTGDNTPKPDGDPMDCLCTSCRNFSHGSHVAGIVAGYGVDLDGNTYQGTYSPATAYGNLRIGPGVAPGAKLLAYRVFGCDGGTAVVSQAINRALDPNQDGDPSDHVDVINLSLGGVYGDGQDADAKTANKAAKAGVVVVVAAGNYGDGYFVASDPAGADRAISVASLGDDGNLEYFLSVNSPSELVGETDAYPASFGPPLPDAPLTANLVRADPAAACSTLTNAAQVAGKIALIDRGDCYFVDKVKQAQVAGAVAVVVVNNEEGVIYMGGNDSTITIPSCSITQADGYALKMKLPSPGVNITLTKSSYGDVVSDFSSRGPRLGDLMLKPDLAAPGSAVSSIYAGKGNQSIGMGGTSMASPQVAGVMAILKQAHPGWTVEELKAVAMNTASHTVYSLPNRTTPLVGPGRIGAGRADVPAGAASSLVAYAPDGTGLVSVSFGSLEVVGVHDAERTVRIVNKGTQPAELALAYAAVADVPGVEIELPDGDRVTVAAGGSADVRLRLHAVASAMKHTHDPSVAELVGDNPRIWLSEEAGYLVLTPATGRELRVPVYAAPRPAAVMAASSSFAASATGGTATLSFSGVGVETGESFPTDVVSLVTTLELQEVSQASASLAAQGLSWADLKLIGVASDYPAQKAAGQGLSQSYLYFGLVMHGTWTTPTEVMVTIGIDTNQDGKDDYLVETGDWDAGTDVVVAMTCKASTYDCHATALGTVKPNVRDLALFGSNAMVIRVPANLSGITEQRSRFNYKVSTARRNVDETLDQSQVLTFDPVTPGLVFGGTGYAGTAAIQPFYRDLPGLDAQVVLNDAAFQADKGLGALLIHHHNLGDRGQAIGIGSGACSLVPTASAPGAARPGEAVVLQATVESSGCGGEPSLVWDFGDGTASETGMSVSHAYARDGLYAWRLTVSSGAFSAMRTGMIRVEDDARGIVRRRLGHGGA